jgi:hypothetical protein
LSQLPPTPFTQQLAQIAVSRALPVGSDIPGTQRVFTFSGNCRDRSGWADVTPGHPIIACYYGSGEEVAGFPGSMKPASKASVLRCKIAPAKG